jgi:hypothetical protein
MRNLLRYPATRAEIVDCLKKEAESANGKSDEELSAGDMTAYLLRKAADIIENLPEHIGELREQASHAWRLRSALEPFASFGDQNVGEHGWLSGIHREQVSTWFGPSDFREATEAYRELGRTAEDDAWLNDAPVGEEQL